MGRKRKAGPNLIPVGRTPDGLVVVQGAFEFFDTYGLPLDLVFARLRQGGFMPDWAHLYDRCIEAGWNPASTWERLRNLVGDVYGPSFRVRWEDIMRKHLER